LVERFDNGLSIEIIIVLERNYVNEEKQDGPTWMAWSCVDVAKDDLETPDTCTKDCPGCVSRERSLRHSSQNQEKKGEGAEVKEIWLSYREVLKGDNVGYESQLFSSILPQKSPFNEVGLGYLYPWDLHSRAKWSSFMMQANLPFYPPS